jgi:hypothetical protein
MNLSICTQDDRIQWWGKVDSCGHKTFLAETRVSSQIAKK